MFEELNDHKTTVEETKNLQRKQIEGLKNLSTAVSLALTDSVESVIYYSPENQPIQLVIIINPNSNQIWARDIFDRPIVESIKNECFLNPLREKLGELSVEKNFKDYFALIRQAKATAALNGGILPFFPTPDRAYSDLLQAIKDNQWAQITQANANGPWMVFFSQDKDDKAVSKESSSVGMKIQPPETADRRFNKP